MTNFGRTNGPIQIIRARGHARGEPHGRTGTQGQREEGGHNRDRGFDHEHVGEGIGHHPRRLHAWSTGLRDPDLCPLMADYAAERADGLTDLIIGICRGFVAPSALVKGFDPEGYLRGIALVDPRGAPGTAGKG